MDRRTVLSTAAAAPAALWASASQAATRGADKSPAAKPSASGLVVQAVQLPAWSSDGRNRQALLPGAVVQAPQEVETAAGGALVLQLPDQSVIRIGESSRLALQQLQSQIDQGQTQLQSELKLYGGMFRYATAAVSKVLGERRINLALRTATVGIRGTDFWCMTDEAHDAACIFEGRVDLATRDQGPLVLDQPTAFWARFFDKPVQPVGQATPKQLNTFLSSTELKPGTGILVPEGSWGLTLAASSEKEAQALAADLSRQGFPAVFLPNRRQVQIRQLASRRDAQAVLDKITALPDMKGRVQAV